MKQRILGIGIMLVVLNVATTGGHFIAFLDIDAILFVLGIAVGGALYAFPIEQLFRVAGNHFKQDLSDSERTELHLVLTSVANIAVGAGVVGAFVFTVKLLSNMGGPETIGPLVGSSILSSFYGCVLGELLLRPAAARHLSVSNVQVRMARGSIALPVAAVLVVGSSLWLSITV